MPNAPIVDHRELPPGVMSRHLPRWMLLAIVVVMIGILAIGGGPVRPKPPGSAPSTPPVATDANQQRIEEYQRRIQEQAERLAQEQVALAETKEAVVTPIEAAGGSSAAARARRSAGPPEGPSSAPDGLSAASLRQEQAQREYRSLFADSLAFSREHERDRSSVLLPPAVDATASSASTIRPDQRTGAATTSRGEAAVTTGEPRYTVPEGTILETVLTNRLDGSFAGPVNCLVTTAVYATDQQHLLIPAGARALGEARPVTAFGQTRLAVAFHRLALPNGTRIDLQDFHGLNQTGDVGLQDEVNRHYAQIFGASLAVGAIAGLAQTQTAIGLDATSLDAYRQGAAANLAQSSARILDRFLNLLPTVTIREGHRVKVYLSNDLELPVYRERGTGRGDGQ